jgi:Helicase HerA, central domain
MPTDPALLGSVQDVNGSTVSVSLEAQTLSGLAFIEGVGYRIGQIGSFVRIPMGFVDLFGVVSQVGAGAAPLNLAAESPGGNRWMTVQIVGEGQSGREFQRGISQYPTIGDQVFLVSERDLARIYGRPDSPNFVRVGHVSSAESIPALIDVTKLVTRHAAVLGATGAGKSTTVAALLAAISEGSRYPSARVLLFDIHGEYANALKDRATVFRVNPDAGSSQKPLYVPYWAMSFDELLGITFGTLDDQSRGVVLEKITDLKLQALKATPRPGITQDNLTVDSPVPFSLHQLWFQFHRAMNATHTVAGGQSETTEALQTNPDGTPVETGDAMKVIAPKYQPHSQAPPRIFLSQSPFNFRRQLDGLASKLRDPRFGFLFRPGPWSPNIDGLPAQDLDTLLRSWLGSSDPIAILDLSGIPVSILNNLVGALLRIVYDAVFWSRKVSEGGRERPLLVVLEEAHAYVGHDQSGGAAQAVRRIVKEGRKYGIGALIVSQRPSEIDTTILSQCGTLFAMRLSNASDRGHVTGTVTDNLEGLLAMLPVLRTGEAIILGEAVHLPVRAQLEPPPINRRPDSADPLIYDDQGPGGWNRKREPSKYQEVISIWRRQDPNSPSVIKENIESEEP